MYRRSAGASVKISGGEREREHLAREDAAVLIRQGEQAQRVAAARRAAAGEGARPERAHLLHGQGPDVRGR